MGVVCCFILLVVVVGGVGGKRRLSEDEVKWGWAVPHSLSV